MKQLKSPNLWHYGLIATALVVVLGAGFLRQVSRGGEPPRGRAGVVPTSFRQTRGLSLEGGVGWLNTAGPIRLEELRGKVVLLDFWTYCCINCHHVLPDLARLEEKYKNELVVIGVHTAKFYAERDTENIRRKVREYGIKHPVINDADQVLWNRFGVESWPTLVLIDPSGEYRGSISGEGHYEILDKVIGQLVKTHRAKGDLNETPIQFFPESEKPDNTPLLFPGKVLADPPGRRLFIADTAHHRLVVTDLQGKGATAIGSGTPGLVDGAYDKAGFNRPQGMCLIGETLYVADTENHAIRAVNLKARTVTTVAGNGQQSHRRTGSGPGKETGLNSPWDVIPMPGTGSHSLLVAMAGPHQIWRFDIDSGVVGVWAGTGAENIIDGLLTNAAFAQPSGLATDKNGDYLYVADSEVSGVRSISLDRRNQRVQTVVGVGLFGFGDVDGVGDAVRLQHCLGLAYGNGNLYIADSYNNKIKVCDPRSRSVETLVGTKQPGSGDNPPQFYQPGGLSLAGSSLYVADTNNHAIRVVDVQERTVKTLELVGLKPPAPASRPPSFPNAQEIHASGIKVAPGEKFTLDVTVPLEKGFKLNTDAPMPYLVQTPNKSGIVAEPVATTGGKVKASSDRLSIEVPLAKPASAGDRFDLKLSLAAFICNEGSSLCQIKSFVWTVPVTVASNGSSHVTLAANVK